MTKATRGSRGFTLVEVLAALIITGLVVLLAGAVFSSLGAAAEGIRASRKALDLRMNARRSLREAFLNLEVGTAGTHPFEGHPEAVAFTTWWMVPEGWLERGDIGIALHHGQLLAERTGVRPIVLADSITRVDFDYLLEPGANTRWVREWVSPVSAPLAVRLRIGRGTATDTLLLLVKERG